MRLNLALVLFIYFVLQYISFDSFIVLGSVFPYQAKRLAWGRLRNDLFCVEWDVKPQLSQLYSPVTLLIIVQK